MFRPEDDSRLFASTLAQDEHLLWAGRPRRERLIYPLDLVRIASGLLFAFAGFYIVRLARGDAGQWTDHSTEPLIECIFLVLIGVFVIGLGGVIKRLLTINYLRYAVTDRRVIIADTRGGLATQSIALRDIRGLTMQVGENRAGTIVLDDIDPRFIPALRYSQENVAYDMPGLRYLFNIPEAEMVHGLLSRLIAEHRPTTETEAEGAAGLDAADQESRIDDLTRWPSSPRRVQLLLAAGVLAGNLIFQFASVWLGLTIAFVRIIPVSHNVFPVAVHLWGPPETAIGVVEGVEAEGGESGGTAYKKYVYRWADATGVVHTSEYHSLGGAFTPGNQIAVEYLPTHPSINRVVGLRSDYTIIGWLAPFLGFGLLIAAVGLRWGLRSLGLLRSGEAALARLSGKVLEKYGESDSFDRASYCYELTYVFRATDGNDYKVFSRVSAGIAHVDKAEAEISLEVPERAYVLYRRDHPAAAIMANQLVGHPRFDRPGLVYSGHPWAALRYLIIPAIVIGGHLFGPALFRLLVQWSV
jgi:hypothetical protein